MAPGLKEILEYAETPQSVLLLGKRCHTLYNPRIPVRAPERNAMIQKIRVESFKSLVQLELELGRVNVLVGANGSGKSNILEAFGILGAAAGGRVDDEALLRRGVRPGVPALYKSAFEKTRGAPHLSFGAFTEEGGAYEVTLWNPLDDPSPAWRFKTETLRQSPTGDNNEKVFSRSVREKENQEQGMAALKTFELDVDDPALLLINLLRNYSIHNPNTPTLRGLVPDLQSREPLGLAGGRLPEALDEILKIAPKNGPELASALAEAGDLIDWARTFAAAPAVGLPLSPSAARSQLVVQFEDRFMNKESRLLTGYDASEGALYILYYAVLALHPKAPAFLAIDNIDQALNPRLAARLMGALCRWVLGSNKKRQWVATTHNAAALDGLPLDRDDVRLFVVERNSRGYTEARRIDLQAALLARPDETWTLSRMWTAGLIGGLPNV